VGIHLLLICFLRPTTALSADKQSDTHERIADKTRRCALKAWLALTHTTGYVFSIPVTSTPQCLWHSFFCGNFRKPIDKASYDAFPLCSIQPSNSIHLNGHHSNKAVIRCKYMKNLRIMKEKEEKDSSFVEFWAFEMELRLRKNCKDLRKKL